MEYRKKKFLWGAATASHQVEGHTDNDWSEWEKKTAHTLHSLKKGVRLPEHAVEGAGRQENYISGRSANHYQLYKEDLALAKELGHNAYRFSIEWSRIEPEEGRFNTEEINHYRSKIEYMKSLGIEPVVTLWHFSNPKWFLAKGGWEKKINIANFLRYVSVIQKEFGNEVQYWITINEPTIYAGVAYFMGEWPPGKKNIFSYWKVLHNLLRAHKTAYGILKSANPDYQISLSHNAPYNVPYRLNLINRIIRWALNLWMVFYVLDRVKYQMDFIGLNFYFKNVITGFSFQWSFDDDEKSDLGWRVSPESVGPLMELVWHRYKKPIMITENGIADAKDTLRSWFITTTLHSCSEAISKGVKVIGYLHWSLLDNFEWAHGYWPRFGLVEVDYDTLERKPRQSAYTYKQIITELDSEFNEQFNKK